jgi:hypothetical protein
MAVLSFLLEEDARLWLRMQVACRRRHGLVNLRNYEQLSTEVLASNANLCNRCFREQVWQNLKSKKESVDLKVVSSEVGCVKSR